MKVAFVSQPWTTPIPPSEATAVWAQQVGRRLVSLREVSAVTIYALGGDEPPQPEVHDGVEYRYIRGKHSWSRPEGTEPERELPRPDQPLFAAPDYHHGYATGIADDLRRHPCDIVHVANFSQFLPVLARAPGPPRRVLHMHCYWLSDLNPEWTVPALSGADLVIGCSDDVTGRIAATLPHLSDRCRTVHYGVDTYTFTPARPPASKRVLFVSRVSPEKGVHVLFEAFDQVLERHPDAELELVGAEAHVPLEMLAWISQDAEVRALAPLYTYDYLNDLRARFPRVTERMHHGGGVEHSGVVEKYRNADLLVAPALTEPFGCAVVEAMACGLPVVASRVGGHAETVKDGETGLLVPPGSPHSLASAIMRLLDDEQTRLAMGAEGRARAMRFFTWSHIVDPLMERYMELLARQ